MLAMNPPILSSCPAMPMAALRKREAVVLGLRHVLDIAEAQISVSAFCRSLGLSPEESWSLKLLVHDIADFLFGRRHAGARLLLRDISSHRAVGMELVIDLGGECVEEESAGQARCLRVLCDVVSSVMSRCRIAGEARLVARRWAKSGRARSRRPPEELQ